MPLKLTLSDRSAWVKLDLPCWQKRKKVIHFAPASIFFFSRIILLHLGLPFDCYYTGFTAKGLDRIIYPGLLALWCKAILLPAGLSGPTLLIITRERYCAEKLIGFIDSRQESPCPAKLSPVDLHFGRMIGYGLLICAPNRHMHQNLPSIHWARTAGKQRHRTTIKPASNQEICVNCSSTMKRQPLSSRSKMLPIISIVNVSTGHC